MAKKKKMTDEEKAKLPEAFRKNMGRFRSLATEELREIVNKGGDATAEKTKRERTFVEDLKLVMSAKMLPAMENVHGNMGLPDDTKDQRMGVVMGLVRKAQSGDVAAQKMIWDALKEYTETKNVKIESSMPTTPTGDIYFTPEDE